MPIECAECDQIIEGEVVWFNPMGKAVHKDHQTLQLLATASTRRQSEQDLPFHPVCFELRTGHQWPPQ